MKNQIITECGNNYNKLTDCIIKNNIKRILVVCSNEKRYSDIIDLLKKNSDIVIFSNFSSNPKLSDIKKGIEKAKQFRPEMLFAIGGGSSIDTAKAIKYYFSESLDFDIEKCFPKENGILLSAMPTTAGSGSEATTFAVVYSNGKKYSVDNDSLLIDYVFFNPLLLKTLPEYQKKATLLDAVCHAVEGYWSVNATEESRGYALTALKSLLKDFRNYFNNDEKVFSSVQYAAFLSGKCINISKTTAAHAMSYKITEIKNIPHGIAAFICLPYVCRSIYKKNKSLNRAYPHLCAMFNASSLEELSDRLLELLQELAIFDKPISVTKQELKVLTESVNVQRLKNLPVKLNKSDIEGLYKNIFYIEE